MSVMYITAMRNARERLRKPEGKDPACRLDGNLQVGLDVEWIRSLGIGPW